MGSLSRPGPQFGAKGPPRPGSLPSLRQQGFALWFWAFLKEELAPYPGRWMIVLRMVLSATVAMILIMTFRLPGAAIAGYYTLLLSRESPITTFRSALTVLLAYLAGAIYSVLSILLFVDYPLTHFLWVIVSIFLCFFVIKVCTNYIGSAAFAFIITIVIPIWDASAPTELLLAATLWAAGSVTVGLGAAVGVEYLFSLFEAHDELISGLTQRLDTIGQFLAARARSNGRANPADHVEKQVAQLAMVGVSRLRRLALSSPDPDVATRRASTLALVGRLVDLSGTMLHLDHVLTPDESHHLQQTAQRIGELSKALGGGAPRPHTSHQHSGAPTGFPLVFELERTTELLALSLSSSSTEQPIAQDQTLPAQPTTFLPDAFTNSEHLVYALRGCLAASICYILFNAIAWRGISTSLATCVITGLTSIGASRQKQILRFAGAIAGGLFFGIGAQVFILPQLDTIVGFTVLFASVTFIAAWFATSSPRLSYFGLQIALAFYLINLQEFYPQTNLGIARDRVVGIGLGLIAMWLVFDTLGSKPAAQVMREIFGTNLHLLAQLAQPWKDGHPANIPRIRTLRDQISANFFSVNSQGDAVLFEVGPRRQRDLALRERLLGWQPRLRSLFLIQVGLLQYRTEVAPDAIPPGILQAQQAFDEQTSASLNVLSTAFTEGTHPPAESSLSGALHALEEAVHEAYDPITPRAQAVLVLSGNLAEIIESLEHEMADSHTVLQ